MTIGARDLVRDVFWLISALNGLWDGWKKGADVTVWMAIIYVSTWFFAVFLTDFGKNGEMLLTWHARITILEKR